MIIRDANVNDINFIFKLYNYWVSKNLFLTKKKIKFLTHKEWFFSKYLKDKLIIIYIAILKKKKIGYFRFNKIKKKIYEVSFALNVKFIGKNHGNILVKKSLKKFLYKKNKSTIITRVKKNNLASVFVLIKNNFIIISYKAKLFSHVAYSKDYIYMRYRD